LCPAAGISFSAMKYASPQMLHSAVVLGDAWEGGRADEPETCLAHWSLPREFFLDAGLEGCLELHPVRFRIFRADAAKLDSPNQGILRTNLLRD
jgi:hypothetical protein